MGIVLAIFIFGFIVFFHELGHFVLARKNGITVHEFWIGMGPTLLHKKVGDTDYCLKLLPIGGACVMGEDDMEDLDENSFNSKSPLQRISVIIAGPVFNFILAFIISIAFICMSGIDKPIVNSVVEGSPAAKAGILAGDEIKEINGKSIHIFREISMYNQFHPGEDMEVVINRNGEEHSVLITPEISEYGIYMMGIGSTYEKGNVLEIIGYSAYEVKYWIEMTLESLGQLVTQKIGMDQLSGPVGIVDAVDTTYQASKEAGALIVTLNMLRIALLLTANLGVMNLLPLPALDGGRLVFLFIELIRGKRVPPEKEGYVHMIGMALLLALMAFVLFNDVKRLFL